MQKMLSKKEVAEMLGLSIYTIDRWIYKKMNLPFFKVGSRVMFNSRDVEDYLFSVRKEPITVSGSES